MGLDQTLTIDITTEQASYSKTQATALFVKLSKLLQTAGYGVMTNYDDDNDIIKLSRIYDLDGQPIPDRFNFAIVNVNRYFRKANQIENYFATHFSKTNPDQDYNCITTEITPETIDMLTDRITIIQNAAPAIKVDTAKELLPTTPGFFFGNTDYDDYYYQNNQQLLSDLDELRQIQINLNNLLKITPFTATMIYSSWW